MAALSLRRLLRRDDGAVAVEMAFVSPLLLLLMFGIYDFGTLFVNVMEVEHATQAGATYALKAFVEGGGVTQSGIQTAVTASTPLTVTIAQDPDRPSLTWTGCPDPSGAAVVTYSGGTCDSGIGTYLSIVGSAPSSSKLGSWVGFPPTLATKIMIRLK